MFVVYFQLLIHIKKILKPFKGGALLIILDKLRSFGYNISFNLYNAANYGAPQTRERVILIGKLNGNKITLPTTNTF